MWKRSKEHRDCLAASPRPVEARLDVTAITASQHHPLPSFLSSSSRSRVPFCHSDPTIDRSNSCRPSLFLFLTPHQTHRSVSPTVASYFSIISSENPLDVPLDRSIQARRCTAPRLRTCGAPWIGYYADISTAQRLSRIP